MQAGANSRALRGRWTVGTERVVPFTVRGLAALCGISANSWSHSGRSKALDQQSEGQARSGFREPYVTVSDSVGAATRNARLNWSRSLGYRLTRRSSGVPLRSGLRYTGMLAGLAEGRRCGGVPAP